MASTVIDTCTVPWIPGPHRLDLLLTDEVPDDHPVTSAFALVFDSLGRTLLTRVNRPGRGWEVPGGHVDEGESPAAAAARELDEETGLELDASRLTLIGGQRITHLAPPPAGYRYASRTFMAFHTARLDHPGAPTRPHPESECGEAGWFTGDEVRSRCRGATWLPLHAALLG
ncbi:NUDIX hydrolase [Thermomonospora umbrina]|uniref:ADP-ribose pyrophosphatase YjhB (NUDIX family) n=1 Tax=Thermomonospora umbrina TaxID=111806 RepID=A0A3D9SWJ3_9ACTN|nr:NUDIX hydrolase [Thermomonospora umbrina]REE96934.1 ADP-ribose pyrophosphatase YjhB (NUDIX family) [Thermomonospora umbrina]